jgi:kynurenine formamidase
MKLIDLSQTLEHATPGAPFYPKPRFKILRNGPHKGWDAEMLTLPSHCGTHIDMPNHKLAQWKGVGDYALESFVGPAFLLDYRDLAPRTEITVAMLRDRLPVLPKKAIVLIATGWAQKRADDAVWYQDMPYLAPDAANFLVESWISGVGIDHWTIGGGEDPKMSLTHTILMAANCWIVENLEFGPAAFALPQPFEVWALPMKLSPKLSGFFCRAVARVP